MIKFRKLYDRLQEGITDFAIVTYVKQPYKQDVKKIYHTLDYAESPELQQYVSQYRKRLKINLWLFVLAFEWFTKEIKE